MTKAEKKAVKDIIATYKAVAKDNEMKGDSVRAMTYKGIATHLERLFEEELKQ